MSAYVVNKSLIAGLVVALDNSDLDHIRAVFGVEGRELIASVLMAENVKSVNYRYQENTSAETFTVRDIAYAKRFNPAEIYDAAQCLRYQSCEHPEWKDSAANQIIGMIEANATRELVEFYRSKNGGLNPWQL